VKVLIQSKLEHLLAQRGLTMEYLYRRLVRHKVAPEAIEALRDFENANGVLSLRVLSDVIAVLDCDLSDLFTVVKKHDLNRLRRDAALRFPQRKQQRLNALLSKASETDLTPAESAELHQLTREYEDGMIVKAEALRVLSTLGEDITPYVGIPENA